MDCWCCGDKCDVVDISGCDIGWDLPGLELIGNLSACVHVHLDKKLERGLETFELESWK